VGDIAASEDALLQQLRVTPLTRVDLVRRTGATDLQVQAALDELIAGAFVVRRPRQLGPAAYELTALGSGRLHLLDQLDAAAARAEARKVAPAPVRPRPAPRPPDPWLLRASTSDRQAAYHALANLYADHQISWNELRYCRRRVRLASSEGELDAILSSLESGTPPPPGPRQAFWKWLGWRLLGGPRPE
jgi:hypothetical protein